MDIDVLIDERGIAWDAYPFLGSSVYPTGRIVWSGIRDIDPGAAPPEVRTKDGETLFVSAMQKEELTVRAAAAGVSVCHRDHVWEALLAPYLDTHFDRAKRAQRNVRLEGLGVPERRRHWIHRRFYALMQSYNFDSGLWDWVSLGLYDFLSALNGRLVQEVSLVPAPPRRARVYAWAMAVADRARP